MKNSTFNVTGMSCAACARTVENALNKNEDIKASVNIATEKVNIEYDENKYNFEKIKKIVENSGYGLVGGCICYPVNLYFNGTYDGNTFT